MTKVKDWVELENYVRDNPNPKYTIEFERFSSKGSPHSGWIKPIVENVKTEENYWENHIYLSTHTFYGKNYEDSTRVLQQLGFDVELDNWDKGEWK